MLQHITAQNPYGCGRPELAVTDAHPCYDDADRLLGNCLVQFQKRDPSRRRPARRRPNAEEVARNNLRTGEPCCVCFSEYGALTGCGALHVVCGSCLRAGLRSVVGDVLKTDNLLCGCFGFLSPRGSWVALAARADTELQDDLHAAGARSREEAAELEYEV